jgi:hypothetical protein
MGAIGTRGIDIIKKLQLTIIKMIKILPTEGKELKFWYLHSLTYVLRKNG